MKTNFCTICNKKFKTILSKELHDIEEHDIIIENKIIELYKNYGSINKLTKELNCSRGLIEYFLKKHNIKILNLSETGILAQKRIKEKLEMEEGIINISQRKIVKDKKKETFMKNYGVDNIRKFKPFYDYVNEICIAKFGKKRINNEEKRKETCLKKYGETHFSKTEIGKNIIIERQNLPENKIFYSENAKNWWKNASNEDKAKISDGIKKSWEGDTTERRKNMSKSKKEYWKNLTDEQKHKILSERFKNVFQSSLEVKIFEVLNFLSIPCKTQYFVKGKSYDFKIRGTNILIEINGNYWHANPKIYKENDLIKYPNNKIVEAKEIWNNDIIKTKNAENFGFIIITIWEDEIKNKKLDELILLLKEKLDAINENKKY